MQIVIALLPIASPLPFPGPAQRLAPQHLVSDPILTGHKADWHPQTPWTQGFSMWLEPKLVTGKKSRLRHRQWTSPWLPSSSCHLKDC